MRLKASAADIGKPFIDHSLCWIAWRNIFLSGTWPDSRDRAFLPFSTASALPAYSQVTQ